MKIFLHFIGTLLVYCVLDISFIGLFARNFIQQQVGPLLAPKPDWAAAIIFYLIFCGGILYFCVYPAMQQGGPNKALFNGAFFGLVTYATYELVNRALLANWPLPLVLVDLAWGIFVGAVLSRISWEIGKWLGLA